jgi:hypothetical protein
VLALVAATLTLSVGIVYTRLSSAGDPVVVAVGDIACDPDPTDTGADARETNGCRMQATSDLAVRLHPTAVLVLGDNQYEDGTLAKYQQTYDRTWGRLKDVTHPAIGKHEYHAPAAVGYFAYFGSAAGDPPTGYYSYNLGSWHVIVLNSNCQRVGGCHEGSPQERWLRADLAMHPAACTLAYWHHPRFSSGPHGTDAWYKAFWQDLYRARADIVLNGHDHDYERFAPQDPAGVPDRAHGIRAFVVGTGGKSLYHIVRIQPTSEVRNDTTYGVLKLALHARSYDWQFVPEPGKTFTDTGSGTCHGRRTAVFTPVADAYADSRFPDGRFGFRRRLIVDHEPLRNSYLRFKVRGLQGRVASAMLRVYVPTQPSYSGSVDGGAVVTLSDTRWSEATVTFRQRPRMNRRVLAALGAVRPGHWYAFDVTGAVAGNGTVSLGLTSSSRDAVYYASRQDKTFAPQLVVTLTS